MRVRVGAGAVRREQNIENLWPVRTVQCFVGPQNRRGLEVLSLALILTGRRINRSHLELSFSLHLTQEVFPSTLKSSPASQPCLQLSHECFLVYLRIYLRIKLQTTS